jgi:hypothetical protein
MSLQYLTLQKELKAPKEEDTFNSWRFVYIDFITKTK